MGGAAVTQAPGDVEDDDGVGDVADEESVVGVEEAVSERVVADVVQSEAPCCCVVCRVRLRSGQSGMVCVDCGAKAHKKCCGLSQWERDRGVRWRCRGCSEPVVRVVGSPAGSPPPREVLPGGKCDVCLRLRRRGQGIRCTMCTRILHVACAELGSRGRAQFVDRNAWKCVACVKQEGERDDAARNDDSVPARVRGGEEGSRSIVVMQWNCDHLSSRIPELEVWLRKNDVDVAVVQETKLRAEDGEVRVSGYEMLRRDRWRGGRSRLSRGGGSLR